MPFDAVEAMLAAHAANNRINTFLIRNVADAARRALPPGGKGRDIASMVAHIHNVRLLWLKSVGTAAPIPEKLEGDQFTKDDAIGALEPSRQVRLADGVLRDLYSSIMFASGSGLQSGLISTRNSLPFWIPIPVATQPPGDPLHWRRTSSPCAHLAPASDGIWTGNLKNGGPICATDSAGRRRPSSPSETLVRSIDPDTRIAKDHARYQDSCLLDLTDERNSGRPADRG